MHLGKFMELRDEHLVYHTWQRCREQVCTPFSSTAFMSLHLKYIPPQASFVSIFGAKGRKTESTAENYAAEMNSH